MVQNALLIIQSGQKLVQATMIPMSGNGNGYSWVGTMITLEWAQIWLPMDKNSQGCPWVTMVSKGGNSNTNANS